MAWPPPRRKTKRQFLAGRPGGNYKAYTNAYTRQHGSPPGRAAGGRPNQPYAGPTYESLLRGVRFETPAQQEARANRMANQGILAQQKIIREEAALMRDEAQRRMLAIAAAGRAAAAQNAGLFGMVGGEYNAAAQEIRGLGTNLSGAAQAVTAGDVARQDAGLAAVGAPGLTVGGPVTGPGLGGATQAGVEAYRGGELPGQSISTAGEAATFGLAGMVSSQNLRATQEALAEFRQSTREADRARVSALKELAAGRPSQAAQFLSQLQESQDRQRELAMSLIAARQTFGLQNQGNQRATAAARQDRATAIQNRRLANQAAQVAGREIDEARSFATGFYTDKMGRMILGKDGKPIPWKKTPSSSSSSSDGGWPSVAAKRQEMAKAIEYFLQDSYDKRGRLVRTKEQAIKMMKARFPGTPDKVIRDFVNSSWPKGAKVGAGGGGLGAQP